MTPITLTPAIERLIALPEPQWVRDPAEWPDYLAETGVTAADVPMLIRLAMEPALHVAEPPFDPNEDTPWIDFLCDHDVEWGAAVHAWRALAQLQAIEALEPLADLFEKNEAYDSDWIREDLKLVFLRLGPAAVPPLAARLLAEGGGESGYNGLTETLGELGKRHPEARDACVEVLTKKLARYRHNAPGVNGFLVMGLVELKAVEAKSTIDAAFAADMVDEMIIGDWEDVQVELGLKEADEAYRSRPRRGRWVKVLTPAPAQPSAPARDARQKQQKAKRKHAQASRRKNRKH